MTGSVGTYEGAWSKDKKHGNGSYISRMGHRCVRHGYGMPGVARGGAHTQQAAALSAGSMRQDWTDTRCGRATDTGAGGLEFSAGGGLWVVMAVWLGVWPWGYCWQLHR